ncbi:MAG TPA: Mut7-C RNAse domain-containing protein [Dehalococcoidales bacterium]|nr:Mut7-C RNAse domain-containing protein [Dehalococcoidales bacterium]
MGADSSVSETRFIVDHNVGKLAKWLRIMGYDSLFFDGEDDSIMVKRALAEGRIILTRDTEIMKRRVITNGRLKAVLIESEEPERQMRQLMTALDLKENLRPFTLCLECNHPLVEISREEVKDRVPPYVYKTQTQYMECPACRRIFWRGTHWEAMTRKLEKLQA